LPFAACRYVPLSIPVFARRDDLSYYPLMSPHAARIFVGQVGNLRPIVNRPSGITYKCQHRLRLAAMWASHAGFFAGTLARFRPSYERASNRAQVIQPDSEASREYYCP
jgi:hypothetical protein